MEDIIMEVFERKRVQLDFVDIEVCVRAGIDGVTNHIFFANEDDMNKVYDVLSNHEAFADGYNLVWKKIKNYHYIVTLVGEIVIECHENMLRITIYNNWEKL